MAKAATSTRVVLEDGRQAETIGVNRDSRLTRMIDRLETQRLCLELAARLIEGLPGPVLEIGLGKGRTYDHLRKILPKREIFVFDRALHAPAEALPDDDHLFHGEFDQTLPEIPKRIGTGAALAHVDIGTDDPKLDAEAAMPSVALEAAVLSTKEVSAISLDVAVSPHPNDTDIAARATILTNHHFTFDFIHSLRSGCGGECSKTMVTARALGVFRTVQEVCKGC